MNRSKLLTSRRALTGLSFTSVASFLVFGILASFVASSSTLSFDSSVLTWINTYASSQFDSFFLVVTELGGVIFVTIVTILLFTYFLYKKRYPDATFVALGIGGSAAIGFMLKAVFERARPDLWEWIIVETHFSFPSGHAIGCSALAICMVILLWRTKWRNVALFAGIIYVLLVSVSRLYLGVHYPSDILGGWLISIAWLTMLASVIHLYRVDNAKKRLI